MRAAFDSNPSYDPTQRNPGMSSSGMRSHAGRGGGGGMYADELNPEDLFNMFFGGGGRGGQFGGGQFGNANGESWPLISLHGANDQSLRSAEEMGSEQQVVEANVDLDKLKQRMPTQSSHCYQLLFYSHSPSSPSCLPYCQVLWNQIQVTHSSQWASIRWIEVHGNEESNTMLTSLNGRHRISGNLFLRRRRERRIWQCTVKRSGYSRRE
jgi:hypothetical protein